MRRILARKKVWAVIREGKIGNVVVTCPELALSDVHCRKVGVGNVRTAEPQNSINKSLGTTHRLWKLLDIRTPVYTIIL